MKWRSSDVFRLRDVIIRSAVCGKLIKTVECPSVRPSVRLSVPHLSVCLSVPSIDGSSDGFAVELGCKRRPDINR